MSAASFSRTDVPQLAIVRVRSAGGPYDEGDLLSIAFTTPSVCRIVRQGESPAVSGSTHDSGADAALASESAPAELLIPETISASVVVAAGPYATGDEVTLSFFDPSIARIHSSRQSAARVQPSSITAAAQIDPSPPSGAQIDPSPLTAARIDPSLFTDARIDRSRLTAEQIGPLPADRSESSPPAAPHTLDTDIAEALTNGAAETWDVARSAVAAEARQRAAEITQSEHSSGTLLAARTRLSWTSDRAHRFVQVCDRLFTVERLGWYRHALAMRLLIPDEIVCGDPATDRDVADELDALRDAAIETLGRPMLAAFMPNFSVSSEWLDSLDNAATARSLSHLRAMLAERAPSRTFGEDPHDDVRRTEGSITILELESAPGASAEAILPLLIANVSPLTAVTEKLTAYRVALTELFGQTAGSAEPVRLSRMALPNQILDDRLWQLVGVVSDAFVGAAAFGA